MTPLEINTATRNLTIAGDAEGLLALFDGLNPAQQERAYNYHIDALIFAPNLGLLDAMVPFNDKYDFYAKRIAEHGEGGVEEMSEAMRSCLREAVEQDDVALLQHMLANATIKEASEASFYVHRLPGVSAGMLAACKEVDERYEALMTATELRTGNQRV